MSLEKISNLPPPPPSNEENPRKKRVKITSACIECRRKKTKCNGEEPCRNCQKSKVDCIYPSAIELDYPKQPSKAALEAIEHRLKTIEDMLKAILQQQSTLQLIDPVETNNHQLPPILSAPLPNPTAAPQLPSPSSFQFDQKHDININNKKRKI